MSYMNIKNAYRDKYVNKRIYEGYENSESFLHEYFDDVVVITLPDRKDKMKTIMNQLNIKPFFFDAVLKDKLTDERLLNEGFIKHGCDLNKGRIACHYSHIEVLKRFLKSNNKTCFIFEDDLTVPDDLNLLKERFKHIHNQLKHNSDLNNWDIINVGRCWDNCKTQTYILNKNGNMPGIVKSDMPKCRHAYAVSRKGANNIIKYSLPLYNIPGDRTIALQGQKNNINIFSITPPLFYQNREEFGTNLDNNAKHLSECSKHSELYDSNLSIDEIKNKINMT